MANGFRKIKSRHYDGVLMDIGLPDMMAIP